MNKKNNPKPKNESKDKHEEKFVNPYAFISLIGQCKKENFELRKFYENKNLLTGWMDCTIKTKTLTFIPNTTNDKAFNDENNKNKKSYDFFSYEDLSTISDLRQIYQKPVIPGSEIRGVIRTAYEALTNSCMSSIDEDGVLHKRNNKSKYPGLLRKENEGWKIYKAERVLLEKTKILENLTEGKEVYIRTYTKNKSKKVEQIATETFEGSEIGYFHRGEEFPNKKHESVFILLEPKEGFSIEGDVIRRLEEVIRIYQENKFHEDYRIKYGEEYTPVYYSKDKKYLSPACITREVFENGLNNIIKTQGDFGPCKKTKEICETCKLFGMIGSEESLASRVRFSDAEVNEIYKEKDYYYYNEIILSELASPKISATEFYLERPEDSVFWNYDYAFDRENKLMKSYYPKINGRKFYWHSMPCVTKSYYNFDANNISEKWNERNLAVRPLKDNISFNTKIYFDKITKEELIKLISVLNLKVSKNDNNVKCHKIGMGKPLGFGSIEFDVSKINFRKIEIQRDVIKYEIIEKTPEYYSSEIANIINSEEQNIKELLKITDFKNRPLNVSYPVVDIGDSKETFNWFTVNRGKVNKPLIELTVPKILSEDNSLPTYKK